MASTARDRSVNSTVAGVFGAVYALVGILGFFISNTFAATDDAKLLGLFEVNHLHNIVHLLIGVALLAAAKSTRTARSANTAIGATYLLLAVVGPFVAGTDANIVALNGADHFLHLASGALLLATGVLADRTARDRTHA